MHMPFSALMGHEGQPIGLRTGRRSAGTARAVQRAMSEASSEPVARNRAAWIEEHKVGWRLGPLSKHVRGRGVVQTGYEVVLFGRVHPAAGKGHEAMARALHEGLRSLAVEALGPAPPEILVCVLPFGRWAVPADRPFTVSSAMPSRSAICLFALPAAIRRKTSISAGVTASSVTCSASSNDTSGESVFRPAWTVRIVSASSLWTRVFNRYPDAPALSARTTWTSPEYVVRTMTVRRELNAYGDDGLDTAHVRHSQVHERDIGAHRTELLDGFAPGPRAAHDGHVGLARQQRGNAFAQ